MWNQEIPLMQRFLTGPKNCSFWRKLKIKTSIDALAIGGILRSAHF
jgi:hypothetical protein